MIALCQQPGPTDDEYTYIAEFVRHRSGYCLTPDQIHVVDARLSPLDRNFGVASFAELTAKLRLDNDPVFATKVVEAILNGETTFFRDVNCFRGLREDIIPEMIAARESTRTLRIWSAACSTGQEPYSVAMLIDDAFPELADWHVVIQATDFSGTHLARAQSGEYSKHEVGRGLPSRYLVKYFEETPDGRWQITDRIRRRIFFEQRNLLEPWPPMMPVDIIMLRNVMIYWSLEDKKKTFKQVRECLAPTGCLILGGAESPYYVDPHFEQRRPDSSSCFRIKT